MAAAPIQTATTRRPSATTQRNSAVSLTELSEALSETVSDPPPAQLGPLLWGIKEQHLDLRSFCLAVRVMIGPGVLQSAIERVGAKKASTRSRELWQRALWFARMGAVFLALHEQCKASASSAVLSTLTPDIRTAASEYPLPPSKRMSLREASLLLTGVCSSSTMVNSDDSDNTLRESTSVRNKRERGLSYDGLMSPQQTKRASFASSRHSLAALECDGMDALVAVASVAMAVSV